MEESSFFNKVWRFNALVLMTAGLMAIGVLGFVGYKIYQDSTRDRNT